MIYLGGVYLWIVGAAICCSLLRGQGVGRLSYGLVRLYVLLYCSAVLPGGWFAGSVAVEAGRKRSPRWLPRVAPKSGGHCRQGDCTSKVRREINARTAATVFLLDTADFREIKKNPAYLVQVLRRQSEQILSEQPTASLLMGLGT